MANKVPCERARHQPTLTRCLLSSSTCARVTRVTGHLADHQPHHLPQLPLQHHHPLLPAGHQPLHPPTSRKLMGRLTCGLSRERSQSWKPLVPTPLTTSSVSSSSREALGDMTSMAGVASS